MLQHDSNRVAASRSLPPVIFLSISGRFPRKEIPARGTQQIYLDKEMNIAYEVRTGSVKGGTMLGKGALPF